MQKQSYADRLKALGLTWTQAAVLKSLRGGNKDIGAVIEETRLPPEDVAEAIAYLVYNGFVESP